MSSVCRNCCPGLVAAVLVLVSATSAVATPDKRWTMPAECEAVAGSEILHRFPREMIEDVQPLHEPIAPTVIGATIAVRPVRGLSRELLQRVLECGFSFAASGSASTDWPRLPASTTIQVRSVGNRFLVDLKAANEVAAEQILQTTLTYKPHS